MLFNIFYLEKKKEAWIRNERITRPKHADSEFYFEVLFHNWAEFM